MINVNVAIWEYFCFNEEYVCMSVRVKKNWKEFVIKTFGVFLFV